MNELPLLNDDERHALIHALGSFFDGTGSYYEHLENLSPDLSVMFDDFCLGLTFPGAVAIGSRGSRSRQAFTVMSITWHQLQIRLRERPKVNFPS